MTNATKNCDTCNKSTLSLLLLRPSPIAKTGDLVPSGATAVASDDAATAGLLPKRLPTESRFALRLLRAGYVHVYIPSPPPGVKNWLVYRVTEQADLVPESSEWFKQQADVACTSNNHNVVGMKLLNIPQAHKVSEIWIAYSANLWNDTLRGKNKANPEVMQMISLAGGSPNTFQPNAANLKGKVLECALAKLSINKATDHDFAFNSMAERVDKLAEHLVKAAACHPKTKGKELAVVLRDPIGIATELNALRLRRHELAEQYMLRPKNRHPLEVNKAIQLFKGNIIADVEQRSLDAVTPIMTKGAFDDTMRVKPNPRGWPPDTRWEPLEPTRENIARHGPNAGTVIFPDHEARARKWARTQSEATWSRMHKYYDEGQRAAWETSFGERMQQLHLQPLTRFEADWNAALNDTSLKKYFTQHFDENDPNDPKKDLSHGCSAGAAYCREVWLAFTPEPFTEAARATYEAQLDAKVGNSDAWMLRAVLANQMSLWEQIITDSGEGDGKRDKAYDFIKGLIGELGGNPKTPAALAIKFSWLTNVTLGFSAGLVGTLAAVAANSAAHAMQSGKAPLDPAVLARLGKAQRLALIHRASEEAFAAADKGTKVKMPVLLTAEFDADLALRILRERGETPKKGVARSIRKKGKVQLSILSDTDELSRLQAQGVAETDAVKALAVQDGATVKINKAAFALEAKQLGAAAAGAAIVLPVDKFTELYQKQRQLAARAPSLLTQYLTQMGKVVTGNGAAQAVRSGVLSIDGRLAIGSMIVQGLGMLNALGSYRKADGDVDKQIDAALGFADGLAGFLGGMAELGAAMLEARLAAQGGKALVDSSALLPALRAAGYGMGFAGNVVNAYACFRSAQGHEKKGNLELARMMRSGALFFTFGSAPLFALAVHSLAEAAVKRGLIQGVGVRLAIEQLGKALGARVLMLSIPGWGWALTAVAVGHMVYVALNTPTEVQQWLKTCYFGKPEKGMPKRQSWGEEEAALKQIEQEAKKDAPPGKEATHA